MHITGQRESSVHETKATSGIKFSHEVNSSVHKTTSNSNQETSGVIVDQERQLVPGAQQQASQPSPDFNAVPVGFAVSHPGKLNQASAGSDTNPQNAVVVDVAHHSTQHDHVSMDGTSHVGNQAASGLSVSHASHIYEEQQVADIPKSNQQSSIELSSSISTSSVDNEASAGFVVSHTGTSAQGINTHTNTDASNVQHRTNNIEMSNVKSKSETSEQFPAVSVASESPAGFAVSYHGPSEAVSNVNVDTGISTQSHTVPQGKGDIAINQKSSVESFDGQGVPSAVQPQPTGFTVSHPSHFQSNIQGSENSAASANVQQESGNTVVHPVQPVAPSVAGVVEQPSVGFAVSHPGQPDTASNTVENSWNPVPTDSKNSGIHQSSQPQQTIQGSSASSELSQPAIGFVVSHSNKETTNTKIVNSVQNNAANINEGTVDYIQNINRVPPTAPSNVPTPTSKWSFSVVKPNENGPPSFSFPSALQNNEIAQQHLNNGVAISSDGEVHADMSSLSSVSSSAHAGVVIDNQQSIHVTSSSSSSGSVQHSVNNAGPSDPNLHIRIQTKIAPNVNLQTGRLDMKNMRTRLLLERLRTLRRRIAALRKQKEQKTKQNLSHIRRHTTTSFEVSSSEVLQPVVTSTVRKKSIHGVKERRMMKIKRAIQQILTKVKQRRMKLTPKAVTIITKWIKYFKRMEQKSPNSGMPIMSTKLLQKVQSSVSGSEGIISGGTSFQSSDVVSGATVGEVIPKDTVVSPLFSGRSATVVSANDASSSRLEMHPVNVNSFEHKTDVTVSKIHKESSKTNSASNSNDNTSEKVDNVATSASSKGKDDVYHGT